MSVRDPTRPRELPKRYQGIEVCADHGAQKICVRGAKYGFVGNLVGTNGSTLPLITDRMSRDQTKPTVRAKTPQQAIKNARAFLARVKRRSR